MSPDDFAALLARRHTVRDFRPDAVPEEVLAAILDDARHVASWSNTRPYALAVATGERLARLRAAYLAAFDASIGLQHRRPGAIAKAVLTGTLPDGDVKTWRPYPPDLRPRSVQVGKALYRHLGIERHDRAARDAAARRNLEFFGAPVVVWLFVHRGLGAVAAHDAGLMLQTLVLSARARGVGSCPLGVLATWRHPVDREFVVPKQYRLITGLALGHASDDPVNDFRAEHPPVALLPSR